MTSHIEPQPNLTEKRYVDYYKKLIEEILWAGLHFKLWQRLVELRKGLPIGITFFATSQKAHFDAMLVHLFKILDKDPQSLSIWKFLNYAESNIGIFSTQAFAQRYKKNIKYHSPVTVGNLKDDRKRLTELVEEIRLLRQWRDKIYAHADLELISRNSKVKLRRPNIQEIEKVIATVFEIVSRYSIAYDKSSYTRRWQGEDDINDVMDILNESLQEGAARAKRLITGELRI